MTITELLSQGRLAPLEARILISHALQWSRVQLVTRSQEALSASQVSAIDALFRRRELGEPIAYITGTREFHGLDFEVTPAVLIPRPETELLVELANERLPQNGSALDLGTGSGAVAVTLAHLRPDASLIATDISTEALQIAERNAARHQSRVNFILSDWYSQISGLFDLIVSNPPYISAGDPHLLQGDLRFEPSGALTDNANGLQAIDAIITGAAQHLKPGGCLLLEHGYDQAASVRERFEDGAWIEIGSWRDLAGIERVSGARLPLR
ncbi:MAG: peptide chain release factor N(5)-glutamine methyltransferase [Oxalobacteraceae bacterium]